jgi:two-component system sensor histidine kinase KdpD
VYLGAAPGVGKTFAMLDEGHRRVERGTDVVIGVVEDHGRARTRERAEGLELIPRQVVQYRGSEFTELDVDAVLRRRPAVVLIDELAHTNIPGVRNTKRWQDVDELLDAGINVITTVNIQHLESLNDVVESITGIEQRETVPDDVVRRADQIELVDMSPEALRRRMAHGNVYPAERIDAALSNYFRLGNLSALRELALLWVADRVDEALDHYRRSHGIESPWPARDRIVVALTGGPEGDTLIRRGSRIAGRSAGRDLLAVYVSRSDGLSSGEPAHLERQRALTESLGGTYHHVVGDDIAESLLEFARGVNASQLVIGGPRRRRLRSLAQPWTGETIIRNSGDIDVHVVTHEPSDTSGGGPSAHPALSPLRQRAGWVLALLAPLSVGLLLLPFRSDLELVTVVLFFLGVTVVVALVGGLWPAISCAVWSSLILNYEFTPPTGTLTISDPENAFALAVFIAIGASVAVVVDRSAARASDARRASSEAQVLSTLAGDVVRSDAGVAALLDRLRESFAQESVALVERVGPRAPWTAVAAVGDDPPTSADAADTTVPIDDERALLLRGRPLDAGDRRVLDAFAAHTVALIDRDRLRGQAERATRLAEADDLRNAILAAVSHDVRTPLAAIKAGVSSMRQEDVTWTPQEQDELLATIEDGTDRLDALLSNLLDLSRLQSGAVRPRQDEVVVADVVANAAEAFDAATVRIELPDDLPDVVADAGLLERILANLIQNGARFSPPDEPLRVLGHADADSVRVMVVDRGPGVPDPDKPRMFEAFQRLGDAPEGSGLGLGLAVAHGFALALSGTLEAEDTPGGGLTMVLTLPCAPERQPEAVGR